MYGRIYEWFGANAAVITDSGAELLGPETATTVRSGGVVVDGPFSEAKEVIGGFSVIDVADLDAAIALARTWPALAAPGVSVEVRPMVVDYSQFDDPGASHVTQAPADDALAGVLREHAGRLVMRLSRAFGDFTLAEDAVAAAVVEALRSGGAPASRPTRSGLTLAARRNARWTRSAATGRRPCPSSGRPRSRTSSTSTPRAPAPTTGSACCSPAATRRWPSRHGSRWTLRAVTGLTTAQVARAFLVSEATLAQRIVRAKRKIVAAGIALEVPDAAALPARLTDVRTVIYACYNEAFVSTTGTQDRRSVRTPFGWPSCTRPLPEDAENGASAKPC